MLPEKKSITAFYEPPYRARNEMIIAELKKFKPTTILEYAACDTDIPELINKLPTQFYPATYDWSDIDVDFVAHAIKRKIRFNIGFLNPSVLDVDAPDSLNFIQWENYECLIANSPEHVESDCEIIQRLNSGTLIIMTLPKFLLKSGGHKRKFETEDSIFERYGEIVEFSRIHNLSETISYNSFLTIGFRK